MFTPIVAVKPASSKKRTCDESKFTSAKAEYKARKEYFRQIDAAANSCPIDWDALPEDFDLEEYKKDKSYFMQSDYSAWIKQSSNMVYKPKKRRTCA